MPLHGNVANFDRSLCTWCVLSDYFQGVNLHANSICRLSKRWRKKLSPSRVASLGSRLSGLYFRGFLPVDLVVYVDTSDSDAYTVCAIQDVLPSRDLTTGPGIGLPIFFTPISNPF